MRMHFTRGEETLVRANSFLDVDVIASGESERANINPQEARGFPLLRSPASYSHDMLKHFIF